ncbi:MAG: hypothetical protein M3N32_06295, partial [Actinomycetota bacterium]|nr:hypothetical protein [Actinomycetota bacterium]
CTGPSTDPRLVRLVHDLVVPPDVEDEGLECYLDDLLDELARPVVGRVARPVGCRRTSIHPALGLTGGPLRAAGAVGSRADAGGWRRIRLSAR